MFTRIVSFIFILLFSSFIFVGTPVHAQEGDTFGVGNVENSTELGGGNLIEIVGNIINVVLGLLGIISVVIILYGGFLIMTSGGKEDQIEKGKKTLLNAVIGLIIIMSSFAIAQFVINALSDATRSGPGSGQNVGGGAPVFNSFAGSGALGSMVEDHYPFRREDDVSRNTKITVTFSKAIEPSTLIKNTNGTCWDGNGNATTTCGKNSPPYYGDCRKDVKNFSWEKHCDTLKTSAVQIYPSTTGTPQTVSSSAMISYENAKDYKQAEAYTFIFKPHDNLGSNSEPVWNTVKLNSNIKQKEITSEGKNKNVFANNGYYSWEFQTDTTFDTDPPVVESVTPQSGQKISKNSIIQINFDEAMDPSSVQGIINDPKKVPFTNVIFNNTSTIGEWKVSNGYKTIEFIPNKKCGTNSCGQDIYCLNLDCPPGKKNCSNTFTSLVRTSKLIQPSSSWEAVPFTGVRDMSGNSLDGGDNQGAQLGGDNQRQGKPMPAGGEEIEQSETSSDNFYWNFTVENTIDKRIPYVYDIEPEIDTPKVDKDANLNITFGLPMLMDTLSNIELREFTKDPKYLDKGNLVKKDDKGNVIGTIDPIWYTPRSSNTTTGGETYTKTNIRHREFGPNDMDLYYFTSVTGSVKAINQNCFYPGMGPKNKAVKCKVDQNIEGKIQNTAAVSKNCTDVTYTSSTDTSCPKQGINLLKGSNSKCIESFESISQPVK